MQDYIKKFLNLFNGYEFGYGQHSNLKATQSGKVEGKGNTVRKELTNEIVRLHLSGEGNSLGIVPLKANNTLRFAALDLDITHRICPLRHTLEELEDKIVKLELPLIVCQSKSKGAHLYCFTKDDVPAETMMKKMAEWAALLGYGACEKFPKQTHRVDDNDVGNWLNMPYFNCKDTIRYAINKHKPIGIEEFFELAELMKVSLNEITHYKIEQIDESYNDAPPCLQTLVNTGVEEGSRNNGLYNFAVYYRDKYPDSYEEKILEINGKVFEPPLGLQEVEAIMKAMKRKDFYYKCNEYPICQFCNKNECRKRKFGIGSGYGGELELENLTKYVSSDGTARWYAEYNGKRLKLDTNHLLNQKALMSKMLEATNQIFVPMKQNVWMEKLDDLLKNCTVYDDPIDASPKGQFRELLDTYLTEGVPGERKEDLLKYNTFLDEKEDKIYFKSANLFAYLKNKRFSYSEQEVWHWLREFDGDSMQMRVGNKKIRVWSLPSPEFYKEDETLV